MDKISIKTFFIGICLLGFYFIAQISTVYPPLEKYYFDYKIDDFEKKLKNLDLNQTYFIKYTDTTGQFPENYKVYLRIYEEDKFEYRLTYQLDESILYGKRIEFNLNGAFNKTNNTGGYRKKDSKNIPELIRRFEENVITKIKN